MAKLCAGPANEAKGFEIFVLRGGDFARPNIEGDPRIGDFVRAAAAKGDGVDANAAKPDRLAAVGVVVDDWPGVAVFGSAAVDAGLPEGGGGEGVTLPDMNIF